MNSRPEITAMLSLSIQRHICPDNDPRIYWAREVTFDYATMNAVRVDFMKFKPVNNTVSGIEKGDFYCYEVKSSVEDFHSKNGHNFLGDYNYYVMPEEVYEQIKKEIPYQIGVYVPDRMNYRGEWYDLKAIKKAKRKDRSRPVSEMLLMMFRSAARDRTTGKPGREGHRAKEGRGYCECSDCSTERKELVDKWIRVKYIWKYRSSLVKMYLWQ